MSSLAFEGVSNEDKKVVTTSDKKEIPESKSTLDLIKTKAKHKKVFKHSIKSDKNEDNISSIDIKEDSISDENETETHSEVVVSPGLRSDSKQLKTETSDKQNEIKEQNDGEVVLHLNPDGDGDVDELLQESDVNDDKKNDNKKENSVKDKPLKRTVHLTPISTIGAVVVHKPKELEEEESYDPSRPVVGSVASVVRMTQRKSSVPIEMQANKSLLLKAIKDANQSTHTKRKRSSVEIDYTPTPIKKRLGERQEVISEEIPEEELHPKDLRNYLRVNKKGITL